MKTKLKLALKEILLELIAGLFLSMITIVYIIMSCVRSNLFGVLTGFFVLVIVMFFETFLIKNYNKSFESNISDLDLEHRVLTDNEIEEILNIEIQDEDL